MYPVLWYQDHQVVKLPRFFIDATEIEDEYATAQETTEDLDTEEHFVCDALVSLTECGMVFFEPSYYDSNHQHPHVSSWGKVCLGTESELAPEQFKDNIEAYVETIRSVLHNYGASESYVRLHRILGRSIGCYGCDCEMDEDDARYVGGEPYCDECSAYCEDCEEYYLSEYVHYSDLENASYCEDCGSQVLVSKDTYGWVLSSDTVYSNFLGEDVWKDADDLVETEDGELMWCEDVFRCEECGAIYSTEDGMLDCCSGEFECPECHATYDDEDEALQCCANSEENEDA